MAFTRDAAAGVAAYANGVQKFGYNDFASSVSLLDNPPLGFFLDDTVGPGEVSAGAVARIRIFNDALTPGEVAAENNSVPCDPSGPPSKPKCKKKKKKCGKKKGAKKKKKKGKKPGKPGKPGKKK